MNIDVLYFGPIAEMVGTNKEKVILDNGLGLLELLTTLTNKYPKLKELSYKIAVNQEIVSDDAPIYDRSEIALLSPFAGG